jgi:hypothetical protein
MTWQSSAIQRLLMLHAARGYSLRKTVVRLGWRTVPTFQMSPYSKRLRNRGMVAFRGAFVDKL